MRQTLERRRVRRLRRTRDHQRVDTGGLGRHDVHHHARRVDGVTTGHIEPHTLDGHPAFGDDGTGTERRRRLRAALIGVHDPGALDGDLKGGPHIGIQESERLVQFLGGHPDGVRAHAVERLTVFQRGHGAAGHDIVDDRTNRGHHGVDVDPTARQGGA